MRDLRDRVAPVRRRHAGRRSLTALVLGALLPLTLPAQATTAGTTDVGLALGASIQGAHGERVMQAAGAHAQLTVGRWLSPRLALRADLTAHGFLGMGCDRFCGPYGADGIWSVTPTLVLHPRLAGLPVYGLVGVGGYRGRQSGDPPITRAGAHVGAGVTMWRTAATSLNAELRYHHLSGPIVGSRYLLPLSVMLVW